MSHCQRQMTWLICFAFMWQVSNFSLWKCWPLISLSSCVFRHRGWHVERCSLGLLIKQQSLGGGEDYATFMNNVDASMEQHHNIPAIYEQPFP